MKQFVKRFIFLSIIFFSSILNPETPAPDSYKINSEPYQEDWDKVNYFHDSGLPKSALERVGLIYKKAKATENPSQIIKSILHKVKYLGQVEEEAFVKALESIHAELTTASNHTKPVLQSILAEIYWQYYQNNRWYIDQRTATKKFKQDDIRTYDTRKLVEETVRFYKESITGIGNLKKIKIENYQAILNSDPRSPPSGRKNRSTVYDFLIFRAIDFFMGSEPDIIRPAETFVIKDPDYFFPVKDFIRLRIHSKDQLAYKFHALVALQELLRFHLQEMKDIAGVVDADLKRLQFVKNHYTGTDGSTLYLKALKSLKDFAQNHPSSADVTFAIAEFWNSESGKYKPLLNDEHKWDKKTAFEICRKVIEESVNYDAPENCKSLQNSIQTKSLRLKTEQVVIPGKPSKALLSYRNVNSLYFSVYEVNKSMMEKLKREYAEYITKHKQYILYEDFLFNHFSGEKASRQFAQVLPQDGDYQEHSVEVKIPPLSIGQYFISVSSSRTLGARHNVSGFAFTAASNISYITRRNSDMSMDYYILDRYTGKNLPGVKAQVLIQEYNNKKSEYETIKGALYTSNEEGYFKIKTPKKSRSFNLEFTNGDDYLYSIDDYSNGSIYNSTNYYQNERYDHDNSDTNKVFIFTDRAIYRPGQTIYFKGMMINGKDPKNQSVVSGYPVGVNLYDVNSQNVGSLSLQTNDYGTFSGTFTAPAGGITGSMRLQSDYGGVQYISVEEYKRPKFEVQFEPVKGNFKLKEKVAVKGYARAYSGANIDNASLRYRVVRSARFPYWWFCYFGYYPSSPAVEISNGTAKTNEKGEFEISFAALPDLSVPANSKPVFQYQVFADVTDLNGETRSAQQFVNVGYTALNVGVEASDSLNLDHGAEWKIKTVNLNGEHEPAKGKITIYKLKSPKKFFRERLWERPDKFVMKREVAYDEFPEDQYEDENNVMKWEKEKETFTFLFDSTKDKILKLKNLSDWNEGNYFLEIQAQDKSGQEVKEVAYFSAYSLSRKEMPSYLPLWILSNKTKYQPGEKAEIHYSSFQKNRILFEVEQNGKDIESGWLDSNSEKKHLQLRIEEAHRGNLSVHFTFFKNNRFYNRSAIYLIPFSNKELSIEFETFRNKLLPGESEEWKLKLKGPQGEKVAAEMLATMYDASLDSFRPNYFNFSIYPYFYDSNRWDKGHETKVADFRIFEKEWNKYVSGAYKSYDSLNWFGIYLYNYRGFRFYRSEHTRYKRKNGHDGKSDLVLDGESELVSEEPSAKKVAEAAPLNQPLGGVTSGKDEPKPGLVSSDKNNQAKNQDLAGVKARTNFNETAFFYPHLETDSNGSIIIKFTVPEALTKWKILGLAHTRDLKFTSIQRELVTQKELMVVPNPPRFFREGDEIDFTAKITNMGDKDLSGNARLEIFDAVKMKPLTADLNIMKAETTQSFQSKKGQSAILSWKIKIPDGLQAINYRVVAKADNVSDGEEAVLPVLTNRMLVTESLPLHHRGNQSKEFSNQKLLNNSSTTLRHHKLTLEYTSNPAWIAIQSLPYIMEYPYECAEQLFTRFYANSLASHIVKSSPEIKKVFDLWKIKAPGSENALVSNLEKNQELKALLLEETPWVRDAIDETERKRRVALLFDLNRMTDELDRALDKLIKLQGGNGGFPWFAGMPEDRYITQHIVSGIGHLDHLGVKQTRENKKAWKMMTNAVTYLDTRMAEDYEELKRVEEKYGLNMAELHIGYFQIQYLYARSFFIKDIPVSGENAEAFEYYKWQAKTYWARFLGQKIITGMIALSLHRMGEETPKKYFTGLESHKLKKFKDEKTPARILKSLDEHSLHSEEMGMYWKSDWGYYWYELPIETQALMIELYSEVAQDTKKVNDLRTWLLKQKQTTDWRTTKATADAIYSLLLKGDSWLNARPGLEIKVGEKIINPMEDKNILTEAGTGYFKINFEGSEIRNNMGKVTLIPLKKGKELAPSWGSMYWQYFENLDKITPHETPLKLKKQIFLQKDTASGPVIEPVTGKLALKPGDLLKVRIELRCDRDMEYIHMKDMRASGLEPTNVFSQYKWQDGLGYYESTRDAATNFFISSLPKGTYVFEYPLRVTHTGNFSNGITTIQSMYAPEFTSHSEGIRLKVGGK